MVEKRQEKKKIATKPITLLAVATMAAIVVVAASLAAYSSIPPSNATPSKQQVDANAQGLIHRPPPREWSLWGKQLPSIDAAKTSTGMTFASLPSDVPQGLKVASIRERISEDGKQKFISVVYAPQNVTAKDNDTFEGVMARGGILMLYSQQTVGPKYNQTAHLQTMIEEGKGARTLQTINGDPAIVAKGMPALELPSSVVIYHANNKSTDIVSLQYDTNTLVRIAKSIQQP